MGGVRRDPRRGIPQAPAVRLCRTAEVTPTGVGIFQRVIPGIGDAFGPLEKALRENFFLALFEGLVEGAPWRGVTHLPVKQARLDLPILMLTPPQNWTSSCVITGHLVAVLTGQVEFLTADHSACI